MGRPRQARISRPSVYLIERYGRHERIRTADLYRVNLSITFTFNYLHVAGDCRTTTKYVEAETLAGDFAGENLSRALDNRRKEMSRSGSKFPSVSACDKSD